MKKPTVVGMSFKDVLELSWRNLKGNATRTLLTMLGIIIGVASTIAVVSVGAAGREQIDGELARFGINRFWIYASTHRGGTPWGELTWEDALFLREKIPDAETICPVVYHGAKISAHGRFLGVEAIGTDGAILEAENLRLARGRFLNDEDLTLNRRVAVIQERTARKLFRGDPIGQKISMYRLSFTVVGVEADAALQIGDSGVERVYLPITAFDQMFGTDRVDEISLTASGGRDIDSLGQRALEALNQKHNTESGFKSLNLAKEKRQADHILDIFTMVVGAIAAVSLVVGGIGIMNVMLVTVKERKQEIGIRKALGATDGQILTQFLSESMLIALLACVLGVLIGVAMTAFCGTVLGIEASVATPVMIFSVIFSAGIGLFFGIYPSSKAARLDPVDALREE